MYNHTAPLSTTGLNGGSTIYRFYTISNPSGAINLNAKIKLKYDDSELQGVNEGTLAIYRSSSNEPTGVWHLIPSTVNTTTNTVTAIGGLSQIDYSTGVVTYYTLASTTSPLRIADDAKNQSTANTTKVSVYPNPFTSTFNIAFAAQVKEEAQLTVLDISGRVFHTAAVQITEGENKLNVCCLDNAPSGIYFVNLKTAAGNNMVRIVKNN